MKPMGLSPGTRWPARSTVAALAMMPLWIYLMGPLLTKGRLVIPFQQLIISNRVGLDQVTTAHCTAMHT